MPSHSLIDAHSVAEMLSLNIKTFYRFVQENTDDTFPKPILFGPRLSRWSKEEVEQWIQKKNKR
tara:strand:- start:660 stop:851 length:192 start_codon:yes stop_codon:yes gene_type:complete